ncbi:sigma-70 family RNA polymerase sigma factor [Streptomyces sp. NPDC001922]|uniref:sigma-70 family RNA polymerase sigma factor n=1 Tax=Streptomyces sp. NPDC001922 TaxID=3364624 RepID=UPI0036736E8E
MLSDAELTDSIRRGEPADAELAELYRRHRIPVRAFAGTCSRDPHTAEDLTSEAFVQTIHAVQRGGGPAGTWRPYLLTVVRRTAIDWADTRRRGELTDDVESHARNVAPVDDGEQFVLRREDEDLVVRSFRTLPERWQAALWHVLVEREPASSVGTMMGLSASGVGSLVERAREGLREAYLSVHAHRGEVSEECRHYGKQLAITLRRPGRRPDKDLARHLEQCDACRRAQIDLVELNSRLRAVLPGAVLLWGGTAYPEMREAGCATGGAEGQVPQVPSTVPAGAGRGAADSTLFSLPRRAGALAALVAVTAGGYLLLPGEPGAEPPQAVRTPTTSGPRGTVSQTPPDSRPSPRRTAPTPRHPSGTPSSGTVTSPAPTPTTAPTPAPAEQENPPPGPAGRTRLRIDSTGRCMEIPAAVPTAGARPQEAGCDGSAAQAWDVVPAGGGRRVLVRNAATRKCLRHTGTRRDRAPVDQQTCDGGDGRQVWRLGVNRSKGTVAFTDGSATMYLGLNDWAQASQGKPHGPEMGTLHHYYGSPSLHFRHDGDVDDLIPG